MENNKNKKSVKFQGDMLNFCDFIQVYVFSTNHHLNRGQTLPGDSARLPPISHQFVLYLCPSYDAGLTCTKMRITDFRFETKSIGQVRNAFSYQIKRLL